MVTDGSGVLSFAAVGASAGQVIQVLGATDSTARTTTSTSFVTGSNTLSVTITPSNASSKFAIFVGHYAYNTASTTFYTIFRDSTNLGGSAGIAVFGSASGTADSQVFYSHLDSPNTTSPITYQAYMKASAATTGYMNSANSTSQIIVMEIKG